VAIAPIVAEMEAPQRGGGGHDNKFTILLDLMADNGSDAIIQINNMSALLFRFLNNRSVHNN
jgi:hypothetical protein